MLTVEGSNNDGRGIAIALLEVDEAMSKDEDVAFSDEFVGNGDGADIEGAIEDEEHVGGMGVDVERAERRCRSWSMVRTCSCESDILK